MDKGDRCVFLRDLSVHASESRDGLKGRKERNFNLSTHTPVEAYLDLLPRKVVLGNLSKINVILGPRPPDEEPYSDAFNVAMIYWPRFDFSQYFSLARAQQQKRIATILHKALLRIAHRKKADPAPFETAYSSLMQQPFPLPEITDFEMRRRLGLLSRAEKRALKRRARKRDGQS
jgi:hypothetical protein